MVKVNPGNSADSVAQWSGTESLHSVGFGKYEPFREQEFRTFLLMRYEQIFDAFERGCEALGAKVGQKFKLSIDTEALRKEFVANLFELGRDPVSDLIQSPGKLSRECSQLPQAEKEKLRTIIGRCFADLPQQCEDLLKVGPALGFIAPQLNALVEDFRSIGEHLSLATSQKMAEGMLLIGKSPSFEAVLRNEIAHTTLFDRAIRAWNPDLSLADYTEKTSLAHGRVLTQRVRIIPEGERLSESTVYMPFEPIMIGGYSSNFGFYRHALTSSDPTIKRPLAAYAPIRTIDIEVLDLLERHGREIPAFEGRVSIGRSLLQRLETIANVASHDYHHNSMYTFRKFAGTSGQALEPHFFSHNSAPVYRSPPLAEYESWKITADRTRLTMLEQFAFRTHRDGMNALFKAQPEIKERLFEQASLYLEDLRTFMNEVREAEGPEIAQRAGRYLAGLYMREMWILFRRNDPGFDRSIRGSVPVNQAIRNLDLAPFRPGTTETYAFLECEGVLPAELTAQRQGRSWRDIADSLRKENPLAYAIVVDRFLDARLLPHLGSDRWINYMEEQSPGWGAKMRALEARLGGIEGAERTQALREFHAENSEAAVRLIYKAEYLAYRTVSTTTNALPAFQLQELTSAIENWDGTRGWKQGAPPEDLMLRSLFPPTGPSVQERALLRSLLSPLLVEPGVWPLIKSSDFTLAYNESPSERRWMNADLERRLSILIETDERYGTLMQALKAQIDPARRGESEFFRPAEAGLGLWLEITLRESGILPWIHDSEVTDTADAMRHYRKIIDSPTLTREPEFRRAKAAFDAFRLSENPSPRGILAAAGRWLKERLF